MMKSINFFWFLVLSMMTIFCQETKVEQVLGVAEKINDLGSQVPGFERVTQSISQGLDIAKDLVTIFKKVPDPDLSLSLREKFVKDKTTLERYIEKYGTIQGVEAINFDDFKLLYDEVKEIFKRYGKSKAVLKAEWGSYHDNEASYIVLIAMQVLKKVTENISEIDNKADLLNFESLLVSVSNRLYAKQNSLMRVVEILEDSEKNILDTNDNEKYLFNEILKKKRKVVDSSLLYNAYNAILDSYSFVLNKNNLYIILRKKLSSLTENLIDLQIKNNISTKKYLDRLETAKTIGDNTTKSPINLLADSQSFETKKTVTNSEVAIPFYGWGRAIFDKKFRKKEISTNKVKDNLYKMNKYIVYGK